MPKYKPKPIGEPIHMTTKRHDLMTFAVLFSILLIFVTLYTTFFMPKSIERNFETGILVTKGSLTKTIDSAKLSATSFPRVNILEFQFTEVTEGLFTLENQNYLLKYCVLRNDSGKMPRLGVLYPEKNPDEVAYYIYFNKTYDVVYVESATNDSTYVAPAKDIKDYQKIEKAIK